MCVCGIAGCSQHDGLLFDELKDCVKKRDSTEGFLETTIYYRLGPVPTFKADSITQRLVCQKTGDWDLFLGSPGMDKGGGW